LNVGPTIWYCFGFVYNIVFLSIDKPNKEWIVVPPINKTTFAMNIVVRNLSLFFIFKKLFNNFDGLCFACTCNTPLCIVIID
jgi:hypothetical protein